MIVRGIRHDEFAAFAALTPESSASIVADVRTAWDEGASGPDRTLVVEDSGHIVARLMLLEQPLGCGTPDREAVIAVPWHSPGADGRAAMLRLLQEATDRALASAISIERRLNPEIHTAVDDWRAILDDAGFELFQEKEGFVWTDDGAPIASPARIATRTLSEVGRSAFAAAMGECIAGTLDRNDRFYVERCGQAQWGLEMVGFCEEGDEGHWQLAYDVHDRLVGYVAVGGFEPDVATIAHVAVAPRHRGRGHIDGLLQLASAAARGRGDHTMLSDVDTENGPMLAAMERNGHRRGVRPWHVWAYRRFG